MTGPTIQPVSRRLLVFVAVLHVLPFLARPVLLGGDEPHFALIAHSLAVDGDLDLADDYREVAAGSAAAGKRARGKVLEPHLRRVGERDLPAHPLGLPLLVAPLLRGLVVAAPEAAPDLLLGLLSLAISFAGLLAGRQLLAGWLGDPRLATALALAVHFSTPLWFTGRTFFTEPHLAALPVLAVLAWTRRWPVLAGVLLGLAFLIKESALVLIVPVLWGLVLRTDGSLRWRLLLGPALAAGVFVLKNLLLTGAPLTTYYPFELGDPVAGALGLLFDPRHGLLPFAPVALLALAGLPRGKAVLRGPLLPALAAFLGLFCLTAAWAAWHGGSCYGPRLLVPALPALALPLAAAWRRWSARPGFRWAFVVATAAGFALQLAAAVDPFAAFWEPTVGELIAARPLVAVGGFLLAVFVATRGLPSERPSAV